MLKCDTLLIVQHWQPKRKTEETEKNLEHSCSDVFTEEVLKLKSNVSRTCTSRYDSAALSEVLQKVKREPAMCQAGRCGRGQGVGPSLWAYNGSSVVDDDGDADGDGDAQTWGSSSKPKKTKKTGGMKNFVFPRQSPESRLDYQV